MGIQLIIEVLDYAPPQLTWREGWILLVLAEDANDGTRECWPGYDGDTEHSAVFRKRVRCSRSQFYAALKSLIDHKVVEVAQRGQRHRRAHYRIVPLRSPSVSVPETGTQKVVSASQETGHREALSVPDSQTLTDSQGPGFEFSGSRFEALSVPETGTPSPQSPQVPSPTSLASGTPTAVAPEQNGEAGREEGAAPDDEHRVAAAVLLDHLELGRPLRSDERGRLLDMIAPRLKLGWPVAALRDTVAGDWGGANNRVAVLHARLEQVPMQPPERKQSERARVDDPVPVGSAQEHVPATVDQAEDHAAKARAALRTSRSGPPPIAEVLAEQAGY